MLETYDPAEIARPRLWWSPERRQADLELFTRPVELKTGESFSLEYQFKYLGEPPI
jgi:hypothetical protein